MQVPGKDVGSVIELPHRLPNSLLRLFCNGGSQRRVADHDGDGGGREIQMFGEMLERYSIAVPITGGRTMISSRHWP